MNRLDLLKQEKETISKMQTLSLDLKDQCQEWYDHEIERIEVYGSENPEISVKDNPMWSYDPNDLHRFVYQVSRQIIEDDEGFMLETITPFCEEIVQQKLSKKDLEEALRMWMAAKTKCQWEEE